MSAALTTAAIIGGTLAAGGGIASSVIGAHAAGSAADKQISAAKTAEQQAQENQQPYLDAGKQSIGMLMQDLQNGTFGPGSIQPFSAPTLEQAENAPGYQFAQQQGDKGILEAQAASGGAITGGTSKSLSAYNQNLATTNYGSVYNQALQSYQAQLSGQQQAFNQLYAPAQLGEGATQNQNSTVSSLLQAQGNAGAAGTIGTANAINSGIGTATNSIGSTLSLGTLLKNLNLGSGGTGSGVIGSGEGTQVSGLPTGIYGGGQSGEGTLAGLFQGNVGAIPG